MSRRKLTLVLACLLAACRHRPSASADGTTLLANALDTTLTFGAWIAAHPTDSVAIGGGPTPEGGEGDIFACREARARLTIAGATFTRLAIFHVPAVKRDFVVPTDTSRFAERVCLLRDVRLTYGDTDSLRVAALADSLDRILRMGASHLPVGVGVDVYAAIDRTDPETGTRLHHDHLLVVERAAGIRTPTPYEPVADGINTAGYDRELADRLMAPVLDSAIQLVTVPSIAADLRAVTAHVQSARAAKSTDSLNTPWMDSLVIRVFRTTGDSAPHLAPPERAALLLAADRTIAAYAGDLSEDTASAANATRVRLQAAGIPFAHNRRTSSNTYTHPWLADAFKADSTGPAGRLILLPLLAAGWSNMTTCAATTRSPGGSSGGDTVIAHGEAALARGETNPLIHYDVAEAYQDDTASRPKAIEHYLTALRTLRDPDLRLRAWTNATRLMLGARVTPTFVCPDE